MMRLFKRYVYLNVRFTSVLVFSFNARIVRLEQSRAISGYEEPSWVIQGYRDGGQASRVLA